MWPGSPSRATLPRWPIPTPTAEIDRYLDSDTARVALVIPFDFSKNIRTGKPASVEVLLDGSNSNTATIALGYITGIAGQFSRRQASSPVPPVIDLRSRVWYNPELKSRNFVIPGLIALIMSVIVSVLTSLTIAREWDRGTMEQLISTPVKPVELVIGKLIPYFLIGFADTALCVVISAFFLGVPLRGSIVLLFAASAIFLTGGLSFGVLISAGTRNQLFASQLGMLTSFLPSFLLSGFIFSIANMPAPLRVFTYAVPARYFVSILKGIFLKGIGLRFLWLEMALLCPLRGRRLYPRLQKAEEKDRVAMFERIKYLAIKEFIQTFRDRRRRILIIIAPLIQLFLFGYVATLDVDNVPRRFSTWTSRRRAGSLSGGWRRRAISLSRACPPPRGRWDISSTRGTCSWRSRSTGGSRRI